MIWTEKLLLFSLFLQTLELWQIRPALSDTGIWRTRDLRAATPASQTFWVLSAKNFDALLILRFLLIPAAIVISAPASFYFFFFASQLIIQMRFQGSFNGGSDYLTTQSLAAVWIFHSFADSPLISQACILYLGIQVCLSYFIAGLSKLPSRDWQRGHALDEFLLSSQYQVPSYWQRKAQAHSVLLKLGTWAVLGFELFFPISLVNPIACWILMPVGAVFHWMNYRIFGLNRFFWAWLACYPVLIETANWIHIRFSL